MKRDLKFCDRVECNHLLSNDDCVLHFHDFWDENEKYPIKGKLEVPKDCPYMLELVMKGDKARKTSHKSSVKATI